MGRSRCGVATVRVQQGPCEQRGVQVRTGPAVARPGGGQGTVDQGSEDFRVRERERGGWDPGCYRQELERGDGKGG